MLKLFLILSLMALSLQSRFLEVMRPGTLQCFPNSCRFKTSDRTRFCDAYVELMVTYNQKMNNTLTESEKSFENQVCLTLHNDTAYNQTSVSNKECDYDAVMSSYAKMFDTTKNTTFSCLNPLYYGPPAVQNSTLQCAVKSSDINEVCDYAEQAWESYVKSNDYEPYYGESERYHGLCESMLSISTNMSIPACTDTDIDNYLNLWGVHNPKKSGSSAKSIAISFVLLAIYVFMLS